MTRSLEEHLRYLISSLESSHFRLLDYAASLVLIKNQIKNRDVNGRHNVDAVDAVDAVKGK